MTVQTFQDTVTLFNSNFTIPQQELGVVETPTSPPQFPHDGLIGFSGPDNSLLGTDSWFSNLCATHAFQECRFGLGLGTDNTGTMYFGGVERMLLRGT
jgi:cathepsin D